ncbi:MAG: hypothetical protein ACR2LQ_13990 [Acidimicrobiales bacterium]
MLIAGAVAAWRHGGDDSEHAAGPCTVSELTSPLNTSGAASGRAIETILLAPPPGTDACTLNGPLTVTITGSADLPVTASSLTLDRGTGLEAPLVLDANHWGEITLVWAGSAAPDAGLTSHCEVAPIQGTRISIRGNAQVEPVLVPVTQADSPLTICGGIASDGAFLIDAAVARQLVDEANRGTESASS